MQKCLALVFAFFWAVALPANTKKKTAADYTQFQHKLSKDQQVVHALDRLTFGPGRAMSRQ